MAAVSAKLLELADPLAGDSARLEHSKGEGVTSGPVLGPVIKQYMGVFQHAAEGAAVMGKDQAG
jgi:hypothetical protein